MGRTMMNRWVVRRYTDAEIWLRDRTDLGGVRLPNGFLESTAPVRAEFLEVKQLHAVGDVTVEEYLHAEGIQARGDVSAPTTAASPRRGRARRRSCADA